MSHSENKTEVKPIVIRPEDIFVGYPILAKTEEERKPFDPINLPFDAFIPPRTTNTVGRTITTSSYEPDWQVGIDLEIELHLLEVRITHEDWGEAQQSHTMDEMLQRASASANVTSVWHHEEAPNRLFLAVNNHPVDAALALFPTADGASIDGGEVDEWQAFSRVQRDGFQVQIVHESRTREYVRGMTKIS